ncbi:MAG: glycosyltransferase family 2 protein [Balneolaceae bacterium]|nr:glycosyltransferase family 2 protein [Balneolaceae bacterium]
MDQDDVDISVIIPTYNMASLLPEAVESVANSSCQNTELIIVDDGSTDDTSAVVRNLIKRYEEQIESPRIRYNQIQHAGKAAALNRALNEIQGAFITVLDADDKLPEQSLEQRYRRAISAQADLVLGGFCTFNGDEIFEVRSAPDFNSFSGLTNKVLFNARSPFHQNSMLISKELMQRVGSFDERLFRAQDKDYALRLIKKARNIEVMEKPVYMYRQYPRGLFNRLRNRACTIRYKSMVIYKHTRGIKRWVALSWGIIIEAGKMGYELFSFYRK